MADTTGAMEDPSLRARAQAHRDSQPQPFTLVGRAYNPELKQRNPDLAFPVEQLASGLEGWMLKVDISEDGTMRLDPDFYVDFGKARSHETRLPNGDPTSEIWS